MKSKKTTRRALFSSIMALILCCAMLVGSTFAWFTDSVTSTNNIIKSGNLDVELEYLVDGKWEKVTATTNVFEEDTLWEPGHTEVVYLKVSNIGTLALKYALEVSVASEIGGTNVKGEPFKLSDYILYGALESETEKVYATREEAREAVQTANKLNFSYVNVDKLLDTNEADYVALVVYMPETVGNEANYLTGTTAPQINLGIDLLATQFANEEDSFGKDYDDEAFTPVAQVNDLGKQTVELFNDINAMTSLDLDASFSFRTTEEAVNAAASGYQYWHADFVVYADHDVKKDSMALAGYYAAYCDLVANGKWIALPVDQDIAANTQIRLLEYMGVTGNYEELLTYIPEFLCGLVDLDGSNNGTTVTVELRLFETEEPSASNGNSHNKETGESILIGRYQHTFTKEVASNAELDTALQNGDTNVTLGSGTYIIPDSAQGKTLTITGNGDTVIATQDDGSYEGCDYSLDGATVTFNNITINTDSSTYTGYARLKATYNNCTINGTYTLYDNSTFNDCTFNVSGDVYNIWTWGAPNATFTGCTFNCSGKAILLYGGANTVLTVADCTFNDANDYAEVNNKAAIEVGSDWTTDTKTIVVTGTTVNGFDVTDKGINTGTTLWGNKNSLPTSRLSVTIDGTKVY